MQIGLIGLQFSGKSTLFQTFSEGGGSDSSRAVVKIPDARLDKLTEIFQPKKQVNATLEALDIPGIAVSDEGKVKITNDFLQKVKNTDAMVHVVRKFNNDAVPHPEGDVDPIRDIEFLETEFLLADMEMIENRLEKIEKDINKSGSEQLKKEKPVFEKLKEHTEKELPLRDLELDDNDQRTISGYQFLTIKPMIIGINFSEDQKDEAGALVEKVKEQFPHLTVIPFFAQFELELAQLSDEEAEEFMSDLGIEESALERMLKTIYDHLGLQSFFTVGEDECRAWTIRKGATAQEAAGTIHTDFYNKFIRAEVVNYKDFIEHGSFAKCKEAGVWRLEGKEYIVQDGDIMTIRHG